VSTWLITGCSTGLGRALASAVLAAGHNAVVTARDVNRVQDLVAASPDRALAVALDVTDPAQVQAAVGAAEERFGDADVLINNARSGYRAAIEEAPDADIQRISVMAVEPGSFRTDFAGRSLAQAATPIVDYADTAGPSDRRRSCFCVPTR
jgi:NAD(P)-dependent dehydrogenase (short-subunit alcohol dehydrogenase family)